MFSICLELLLIGLSLPGFNVLFQFSVLVFDYVHVFFHFMQTFQVTKFLKLSFKILFHVFIHFFYFVRFITSVLNSTSVS